MIKVKGWQGQNLYLPTEHRGAGLRWGWGPLAGVPAPTLPWGVGAVQREQIKVSPNMASTEVGYQFVWWRGLWISYLRTEKTLAILPMARILFLITSFLCWAWPRQWRQIHTNMMGRGVFSGNQNSHKYKYTVKHLGLLSSIKRQQYIALQKFVVHSEMHNLWNKVERTSQQKSPSKPTHKEQTNPSFQIKWKSKK